MIPGPDPAGWSEEEWEAEEERVAELLEVDPVALMWESED